MKPLLIGIFAVTLLTVGLAPLPAQDLPQLGATVDVFAWSLGREAPRDIGDLTGDGVPDYIFRQTCFEEFLQFYTWNWTLVSGATGEAVRIIHSGQQADQTFRVFPAGDLDGDGHDDFGLVVQNSSIPSIATPSDRTPTRVEARSGADNGLLWTFDIFDETATPTGAEFLPVGDTTGDGVTDFVVSVRRNDRTATRWVSGADGALLHEIIDTSASVTSAIPVGDLTGDGIIDVALTLPGSDFVAPAAGTVALVSGATYQYIRFLHGSMSQENFGRDVTDIPDRDGDGVPDLLIVSGSETTFDLFSGATGQRLPDVAHPSPGAILRRLPPTDWNEDGVPDLIFSTDAPTVTFFTGESLTVVSGSDLGLIESLPVGHGVTRDVNGDDISDLLVSQGPAVPGTCPPAGTGHIELRFGAQSFGEGSESLELRWIPGLLGPRAGRVQLNYAAPFAPLVLAASLDRADEGSVLPGTILPLGISIAPGDLLLNLPLPATGAGTFGFDLSLVEPSVAGAIVHLQVLQVAPTLEISNGLSIVFAP